MGCDEKNGIVVLVTVNALRWLFTNGG